MPSIALLRTLGKGVGLVRPSSNRCQALSPMYSLGQGSTMVRGDILARCDIHPFTLPPYPGNKIAPLTSFHFLKNGRIPVSQCDKYLFLLRFSVPTGTFPLGTLFARGLSSASTAGAGQGDAEVGRRRRGHGGTTTKTRGTQQHDARHL